MAIVYLVRHGQASFGKDDYDALSPLGEIQGARLGSSLKGRVSPDLVIQGAMTRHAQTARQCLQAMAVEPMVETDGAWNEYDHQAVLAGVDPALIEPKAVKRFLATQEDPKAAFHQLFSNAITKWQKGQGEYPESWLGFKQRVEDALERLVNRVRQTPELKQVMVFTSGGPISCLSQSLLGVPDNRLLQMNWTLVNAGVTKLVVTKDRVFLASLNEHSAFEGEHASLVSYR